MLTENPAFTMAIEQFNSGDYYACHDTLEEIWHGAWQEDRHFYQGILQVAVGLYHLQNRNWRGAMILLGEGISRLPEYEPSYHGVMVTELRDGAAEILGQIQQAYSQGESALELYLSGVAMPQIVMVVEL
jgi:predicted metal-dependent hydrolase